MVDCIVVSPTPLLLGQTPAGFSIFVVLPPLPSFIPWFSLHNLFFLVFWILFESCRSVSWSMAIPGARLQAFKRASFCANGLVSVSVASFLTMTPQPLTRTANFPYPCPDTKVVDNPFPRRAPVLECFFRRCFPPFPFTGALSAYTLLLPSSFSFFFLLFVRRFFHFFPPPTPPPAKNLSVSLSPLSGDRP